MTGANASNPGESLTDLAGQIAARGDQPAVIRFTPEDREAWSGERIGTTAARLAGGLRAGGLEPGEAVLLFAPASPEFVAVTLAVLRAGGVVTPIDVQTSDEHLEHVLKDSATRRVFTTRMLARRLDKVPAARALKRHLLDAEDGETDSWLGLLAAETGDPATVGGDDPAVLFYTSGTTGLPKGVPLSHRNIRFQLQAIADAGIVTDGDRMLLPLPLHHVYPVVIGVLTPVALGVPVIIPHALTGGAVTRAMREGEATVLLGVPRLYRAIHQGLLERVRSSGRLRSWIFGAMLATSRLGNRFGLALGRRLFGAVHARVGPSVRLLASGGSPLDPALAEDLEALGWPVAIGYGLTETSPILTIKRPGERRHRSVGRALSGVELKVDPAVLPEAPAGAESKGEAAERPHGELLARGPGVFAGYHNLPQESEGAFADGWFRTGDLAAIDADGFVHLHGRVGTMIVLEGGENIDPEKVEAAYESCPEVEELGVLDDGGRLAALVVPSKDLLRDHGERESARRVRLAIEQRARTLPSYQHLYRLEFRTKALQRTRLGKLQRADLAEDYRRAKAGVAASVQAGPVAEEDMSSEAQVLMENPRVRKLWELLVERYPDKPLAPESSLEFDLGIDSLDWVNLSLTLEEQLDVAVDDSWLARVSSVQDLMALVAGEGESGSVPQEVPAGRARRPIEEPDSVLSEQDRRRAAPRGPVATAIATFLYGILKLIAIPYLRVRARGLERVPESGPFILLPNHVSYLDAPALGIALGYSRAKRCFWAGWAGLLFRNAFWRTISHLAQVVPIERERGPITSLSFGALVLKQGHPLVWFPEGSLSREGGLQEFRQGIGLLLEHHSVPVIPVYFEGTDTSLPPGSWFLRPGPVTVHFGDPIDPAELLRDLPGPAHGDDRHVHITAALQQAMIRLRDQIRVD